MLRSVLGHGGLERRREATQQHQQRHTLAQVVSAAPAQGLASDLQPVEDRREELVQLVAGVSTAGPQHVRRVLGETRHDAALEGRDQRRDVLHALEWDAKWRVKGCTQQVKAAHSVYGEEDQWRRRVQLDMCLWSCSKPLAAPLDGSSQRGTVGEQGLDAADTDTFI
ncbi:unnamed protein product [Phytophthora lilii]|uniref:Unnamed protein product n=1 Tax=Phytophthora lilii TaxID=2077276 RepID=A0A9W6X2S5_9STRA|nr:unnamed protein product [Phytophthora lilii]